MPEENANEIIEEIMKRITASEDTKHYGYWKVVYKDDYGDDRVVYEYSIDTIKNYYNMDESPEDFELEDIIKRSFKNRLKVAYASDGKRGLERVLEPFEFLH